MLHTLEEDSTMFPGLETSCDFSSEGEASENQVDQPIIRHSGDNSNA